MSILFKLNRDKHVILDKLHAHLLTHPDINEEYVRILKNLDGKLLTDIIKWTCHPLAVWHICFPGIQARLDQINLNDTSRANDKGLAFLNYGVTNVNYMNIFLVDKKNLTSTRLGSAALRHGRPFRQYVPNSMSQVEI